jgi:aryl-alcohol dehydrogenase-like predicted oxidoreductase
MRLRAAWGEPESPGASREMLRDAVRLGVDFIDWEDSLRRLRLDTIDLWQLHRIDPAVPVEEQLGAIRALRDAGKIRCVGVSEVTPGELERARGLVDIATVLPIPETSMPDHTRENIDAALIELSDDDVAVLERQG